MTSCSEEMDRFADHPATRYKEMTRGHSRFGSFSPSLHHINTVDVIDGLRSPRKTLKGFVTGPVFSSLTCVFIVANAVFIGLEANESMDIVIHARHDSSDFDPNIPGWYEQVEIAFTRVFAVEMLLRILALNIEFFTGADWHWNLFDSVLVILSLIPMVMDMTALNMGLFGAFRTLKILRTFRMLRLLRFIRSLRSLRLMLLALAQGLVPFFWAIFFLLFIMYIFALILMQGVVEHVGDLSANAYVVEELTSYFHSLPMALLTLFLSVSGGVSWWEVGELLLDISVVYLLLFTLFVVILLLAVMNMITGIFVNDSLEMAGMDRDIRAQADKQRNLDHVHLLQQLFVQLDTDGSGQLTLEELEDHIFSDEVMATFSMVNLEVSDAVSFFKILDVDESKSLEIEEFVVGCMRLRGSVNTVDFETLARENKRMMKKYSQQVHLVASKVELVYKSLADLHIHLGSTTDLVKPSHPSFLIA